MKFPNSTPRPAVVNAAVLRATPLERLPTELLQIIFFHCLNPSLPQASHILGWILSSFYVRARLFETVFSFDRGGSNQLLYAEHLKDIFRLSTHWEDEIFRLQSEVLKASWVKAAFFRHYLPIFLDSTINALSGGKDLPIFVHRPVRVPNEDETLERFPETRARPVTRSSTHRPEVLARLSCKQIKAINVSVLFWDQDHMEGQVHLAHRDVWMLKWVDSDGTPVLEETDEPTEWQPHIPSWMHAWREPQSRTMLHCPSGCYIPAKFLGGPWTKDQYHIVAMLFEAGAEIDAEDSTVGRIALQGFLYALKDRNTKIIRHLLRWLRPGPEYLVYAAVYLDCPKVICELMIRRLREHWINMHSTILKDWADQQAARGNHRGSWLLGIMDRFRCYGLWEGEEWVYIPPEDLDSSPGVFEPITSALMDDQIYSPYRDESPCWVEWFNPTSPSLEDDQNDGPP